MYIYLCNMQPLLYKVQVQSLPCILVLLYWLWSSFDTQSYITNPKIRDPLKRRFRTWKLYKLSCSGSMLNFGGWNINSQHQLGWAQTPPATLKIPVTNHTRQWIHMTIILVDLKIWMILDTRDIRWEIRITESSWEMLNLSSYKIIGDKQKKTHVGNRPSFCDAPNSGKKNHEMGASRKALGRGRGTTWERSSSKEPKVWRLGLPWVSTICCESLGVARNPPGRRETNSATGGPLLGIPKTRCGKGKGGHESYQMFSYVTMWIWHLR